MGWEKHSCYCETLNPLCSHIAIGATFKFMHLSKVIAEEHLYCAGSASRSWDRSDQNSKREGQRSWRSTIGRPTENAGIWTAEAGKGIGNL